MSALQDVQWRGRNSEPVDKTPSWGDNSRHIGGGRNLAERTLRRHLARRGATTRALHQAQRGKPYTRFQRSHFGDLWQGDLMDGPYLPDPADPQRQRQTFLFAFLDDYTRLIPHAQF